MSDSPSDPTGSTPSPAAALQAAGQWIARGQTLEAQGEPAALAEAVRSYDAAIALVRALPSGGREPTGFHLGVAWMNRGNALQKQAAPDSLAESIRAYDNAIAAFRTLPPELPPPVRNALGAAWLNRGVSLHRLPAHDRVADAVGSFREAIAVFDTLPADGSPWHRRNLAGVRLNLANALLDHTPASAADASTAAREALGLVQPFEFTDRVEADLSLKLRRVLLDSLGSQLMAAEKSGADTRVLADEAGDVVDEGLALVRHWELQGVRDFRPLAARLFHFGAQLYRLNQPHFLAEFLLDTLDPDQAPGAMPDDEALHRIAAGSLAQALQVLQGRPLVLDGAAEDNRFVQTWRSLKAADARLGDLRDRHLPKPS
jgi:hypothetical protein